MPSVKRRGTQAFANHAHRKSRRHKPRSKRYSGPCGAGKHASRGGQAGAFTWICSSLRPPDDWMAMLCSLPVALSRALTCTMPLASMSNVTCRGSVLDTARVTARWSHHTPRRPKERFLTVLIAHPMPYIERGGGCCVCVCVWGAQRHYRGTLVWVGHLDLGGAAGGRRDADQVELAQQLVVCGHVALSLQNLNAHLGLIVCGGGELLSARKSSENGATMSRHCPVKANRPPLGTRARATGPEQ